MSLETKSNCRN